MAKAGVSERVVTIQELATHNTRADAWIALNGRVYNVTGYLVGHPGGVDQIMRGVGTDATNLFNEVHNYVSYQTILKKLLVGRLVYDQVETATEGQPNKPPSRSDFM